MHECPACGFACDCDGEDLWNDDNAEDCICNCENSDDNPNEALAYNEDEDEYDLPARWSAYIGRDTLKEETE